MQTSIFEAGPAFPLTHEDILALHHDYIDEGETDTDAFTWTDVKGGRTYFFYGTKVFQHKPGTAETARLIVDGKSWSSATLGPDALFNLFFGLKTRKREIFRGLITETFACCNDFKRCSEAGGCLHPEDRFYNGCFYRRNLEAGRNFYKEG